MARVSSLFALPESIRTDLVKRRSELKYFTLNDHVDWLAEQGYVVSRSALGRYLVEHESSILEAEAQRREADIAGRNQAQSLIRLTCLEVASRFCDGATKEDLLRTSKELMAWVETANEA